MAYTYLIGWSKLDKWYYGVRYAKDCDPTDLWTGYFTSSRYVKNFRDLHGEPDVITIRREFDNGQDALDWETKVLMRMNAAQNERFLNKSATLFKMNSDPWNKGITGTHMSEETKRKISEAHTGKPKSKESALKSGLSRRGKKRTQEQRKKLADAHKGYVWSDESKEKLSNSNKGKQFSSEHRESISKVALSRPRVSCSTCRRNLPANSLTLHLRSCTL